LKNHDDKASIDVILFSMAVSAWTLFHPFLSPVHSTRHGQWSPDTTQCFNILCL